MDEMSWRARLAKSNINILNVDDERWYYEFMYHPRPGQTKWCKTFYLMRADIDIFYFPLTQKYTMRDPAIVANHVMEEVLELRKELED